MRGLHKNISKDLWVVVSLFSAFLLCLPADAVAGESGEKIGVLQEKISTEASAPKVLEKFKLPKARQILVGIKTSKVRKEELRKSTRLVGRVVPDPQAYAHVVPSQPARVLADRDFPLPVIGQKVAAGDILYVVAPILSNVEKTTQRGELSKIENEIAQLQKEFDRYKNLTKFVAQKEIENAQLNLERAQKHKAELLKTALGREILISPLSGVVVDSHIVTGQVVTPDKPMAEIVDPAQFQIEAYLFDYSLSNKIIAAKARAKEYSDVFFALESIGISPRVNSKDLGIHLLFRAKEPQDYLKIGAPLDVFIDTELQGKMGLTIQKSSVVEKNNQKLIYVLLTAEDVECRVLKLGQDLGSHWEVLEGIQESERVVTEGAYLLSGR